MLNDMLFVVQAPRLVVVQAVLGECRLRFALQLHVVVQLEFRLHPELGLPYFHFSDSSSV